MNSESTNNHTSPNESALKKATTREGIFQVREKIHPKYEKTTITCACGSSFITRSTKSSQKLEICSSCHPFFTGKQKFIDSAGRVEKYLQRYGKSAEAKVEKTSEENKQTS